MTYNSQDTIRKTLQSLLDHWPSALSCHVYVIDNGSDSLREKSPANSLPKGKSSAKDLPIEDLPGFHDDRFTFVASEHGNVGFGAAHNFVLPLLDSACHLIMNPDIVLLDDNSIPTLVSYLNGHPDVGMTVPQIVGDDGKLQYLCRRNPTVLDLFLRFFPGKLGTKRQDYHTMKDKNYTQSFEVEFASGCFMMIRTELFKKLGGFDERFFLYAEDADLTRRVNLTSKTVYVPEAIVRHGWQRASYKNPRLTCIHMKSLFAYFGKWGFAFK